MAVLDLANNDTAEVKFCTYVLLLVLFLNLYANLFYLFVICLLFIYIYLFISVFIYLFIYLYIYLFIYLLFRYVISIFLVLFTLRFFYDLVMLIYKCRLCVCVNRTIDVDLGWCSMEAVSGQTGITVSCIQHIIQVYLKKNTIRISITRLYNFFLA